MTLLRPSCLKTVQSANFPCAKLLTAFYSAAFVQVASSSGYENKKIRDALDFFYGNRTLL